MGRPKDEGGGLRVERLSPALLGDYLAFFGGPAFSDNPQWANCWCTHFYREPRPEGSPRETRRQLAVRLIETGRMDGYLACEGAGEVVGWCAANRKSAIPAYRDAEDAEAVKLVACFVIHPGRRRSGVATALLARVVDDARREGFARVEGRPSLRAATDGGNFRGPLALYEDFGFSLGKLGRGGLATLDLSGLES